MQVGEFPVTIKTVSVSPIILPNPSIIPANIPGKAAGRRTLNIVSILFAPRAKEASLYDLSRAFNESSAILTIVGIAMKASIIPPVRAVRPLFRLNRFFIGPERTYRPINPRTTDGIADIVSIVTFSIVLVLGEAYSEIYTAVEIRTGIEIIRATNVTQKDPASNGSSP